MVSTLGVGPNHYQVLGIEPAASDEEIARAFARKMGLFPPVGQSTRIATAYEVLRDPAKRRDYDIAMGFRPEPKPGHVPAISFKISVGPPPAPTAKPEPAPFVAAAPPPVEQPPAQAEAERMLQMPIAGQLADDDVREERPSGLRRGAAVAGGIVLAAALVGAWAGSAAGDSEEPQAAGRAVSVALPPSKPAPPKAAGGTDAVEGWTASPAAAALPVQRAERSRPAQRPRPSADRLAEIKQSLQSGGYYAEAATEPAAEPAAAEAPAAAPAAASMPLNERVVARTIRRIGYSCGEVASTTAIEGEAGVYKVTCTSGHSYRAAPVRGRYRFRRIGG